MARTKGDKFSAREPALGYLYQGRFALLQLLRLPEDVTLFLEKEDDIEFVESDGAKNLGSLKHKKAGDRLTDMSKDFWKSVRIWLDRYTSNEKMKSNYTFYLFTTSEIPSSSFLKKLSTSEKESSDLLECKKEFLAILKKSTSKECNLVSKMIENFDDKEIEDFISRIEICESSNRIESIKSKIINNHFKTIRPDFREDVFERLEGWWSNKVISMLIGDKDEGISGYELSFRLSELADQYKNDRLPILDDNEFGEVAIENDNDQNYIYQLKAIGVSPKRIRYAINDYYRACEHRSHWASKNLLIQDELQNYDSRLIEEWDRFKEIIIDKLEPDAAEDLLVKAGKEIYEYIDIKLNYPRIKKDVSENYIARGSYHMLANEATPRVWWHPKFLDRIDNILQGAGDGMEQTLD